MNFKLTNVKPRRRPTAFGWLVAAGAAGLLMAGAVTSSYPFLAPQKPPHHGIMVVEGWIHDFALDEAVSMYRSGSYSKIVCAGVPIETGSYIQAFKSYPEMTAARLRKLGIAPEEIIVAIGEETKKDRTYVAAVALRESIMAYNIGETNIHLVTTGPHGRRSRLLFRQALGKGYKVGVTSLEDSAYDPEHWYAYSQGVRTVIGEFIAYCYARFFFFH